ncbi:MAG: hypothetical protein K2W85_17040 [Phycisphaerales bacterium]|nr:hypothetical protein [Phycisphaerales bacterium]
MALRLSERHKLSLVFVVLGLSAVWIVVFAVRSVNPHGTLHNPDTPGAPIARELQAEIQNIPGCSDVGVSVVTDHPLVLRLDGAVRSDDTFAQIEKVIADFGAKAQVENKVEVLH